MAFLPRYCDNRAFEYDGFNKATGNSREGGAAHLVEPKDGRQSAKARQENIDGDHPESGNEDLSVTGRNTLPHTVAEWEDEMAKALWLVSEMNNWGHCWGIGPRKTEKDLLNGIGSACHPVHSPWQD